MIGELICHKSDKEIRSVLDLGCAGGTLLPVLQERGVQSYIGVDISHAALAEARRAYPSAEYQVGTVENFHSTKSFDLIVLSEVLYYLDFRYVVANVRRCSELLVPGGMLCISLNLRNPKARAIQRKLESQLQYIGGFLYQEKSQIDDRLQRNRECPPYHTFLARINPAA
jgi:2-polyprenyl-3-methyl-5-hydroxy-6-metoxy-1,4-benzoquinol methylase